MAERAAVVVLAGGLATRMGGGDKCLLPMGGRPLLAGILERCGARAVALNANGDAARFAEFGLPVIADGVADFPGPLAGVLAGMDWAAGQGCSHVISVAGDTPFFPDDLCDVFEREADGRTILMAGSREPDGRLVRQPTFGCWPVALRDDLRAAIGEGVRKVVIWAERHPMRVVDFGDSAAFFNINRPDDLVEAETRVGGGS